MYHRHYGYFWAEKADDFARVADEVLARRKDSVESVKYIARYFAEGLDRTPRAAEVLREAHTRGVLDEAGIFQLVGYLHHLERYEESIALLEPLMEKRPAELQYRVYLMRAYFKTARHEQLVKLLDETDDFFHQENRWTEGVLAALAAQLPGERTVRAERGLLQGADPAARAHASGTRHRTGDAFGLLLRAGPGARRLEADGRSGGGGLRGDRQLGAAARSAASTR